MHRRRPVWLILLPLITLAACTGAPDGVTPVKGFEPERYLGTWYEIARLDHSFERGMTNVTATYSENEDGTIAVLNRGFKLDDCTFETAEGVAKFQGARDVASLSVTFFWPFQGGYHVFALDKEGYQHAMVAGPNRNYLWVLARTPDLSEAVKTDLVKIAAENGFATDNLIWVSHETLPCGKEAAP